MIKYLGTHNSGTSSKLVWWQRPFGYLLNLTSRCQTLSIEEQLKNNVRLFNLQVTFYNNECVFSHGLCIYTGKLLDAIESMKQYATKESPVYFQLFLDKNFLLGQNKEAFKKLVCDLLNDLRDTNVYMVYAYIEGSDEYPHRNGNIKINTSEHYWTTSWAKNNAKSWIDKLPLPKRHAKIYNDKYMEENKADYLMLDFIEIGKHFIEIGNHFINAGNKTSTTSKKPVTTTTSKKPVTTTTSSKYPVTTTTTWLPTTTTSTISIIPTPIYTPVFPKTTTTSSKYPVTTTTTWFPTTTTSNGPIYHTWPPVLFKSSDGKQKNNVLIKGICGKETIVVSHLPYTTSFAYDSNELVSFVCDNNGVLYYRKKDSTSAVKVGNKKFTASELYNLVIIYKEKSVVTTTTTSLPTTTTTWYHTTTTDIPLCLNIHFDGNNYVYKHDDYRIWTDGKRFSLMFYRYFVPSWNESFDINHDSSLTNVHCEFRIDSGGTGYLYITGDICGASYMHHIYLNVNTTTTPYPTTTTTWYPTTTTTYRPTTTPWPWTTTTLRPTTTTTWYPTTTTDIPLCLNVHFNGNNYVYKHNDYRIWTDGRRFSLIFDRYCVQSWNESFNINYDSSLTNVNTDIVPDGAYGGCIYITGDICRASYMHHIYLNVNTTTTPYPTTTTTWYLTTTTYRPTTTPWPWTTTTLRPTTTRRPTTTTTIIYDGNSPAGNGNPRPTTTTTRRPTTTPWPWTTTTLRPTTTTWRPTTTTTYMLYF